MIVKGALTFGRLCRNLRQMASTEGAEALGTDLELYQVVRTTMIETTESIELSSATTS